MYTHTAITSQAWRQVHGDFLGPDLNEALEANWSPDRFLGSFDETSKIHDRDANAKCTCANVYSMKMGTVIV